MREGDFEIRMEKVFAEVQNSFSVMYLSDFHFTKNSRDTVLWMLKKIALLQPDIILMGGDYVDTPKGLKELDFFLAELLERENVFAVAGNHDLFFGIKKIKNVFLERNVNWIEQTSSEIKLKGMNLQIIGNQLHPYVENTHFSILCVHNPKILNENLSSYDLAFGGHLHGSQFVFWQNEKGLYPGRFFYSWNILFRRKNNCDCFISKGLGDTLPFRYNCKKDIILVNVKPINKK